MAKATPKVWNYFVCAEASGRVVQGGTLPNIRVDRVFAFAQPLGVNNWSQARQIIADDLVKQNPEMKNFSIISCQYLPQ